VKDAPSTATRREGDWNRLAELLDRLLGLEADLQAAELRELRESDPELAELAARYLKHRSALHSFLYRPLLDRASEQVVRLAEGTRIGPYEIIECLGMGGMGEVYLAHRVDVFDQRVALKVLRRGRSTPSWQRRFERERQLLAHLVHPNIASLLDGGTSGDGLPYLVMEYVDGIPVDRFILQRRLNLRRRLELFLQICQAVAYLHRNVVVHRDIKPGNVLVGAGGVPKLVDFGIAKSLGDSELNAQITDEAGPPRTLLFSSPEQVRGMPINIATDVYSLGVLLSLMLTGEPPYRRPRGSSWSRQELENAICHAPPWPPSHIAANIDGRRISRDLDSIALKALEKERDERYGSVDALALDLRRFLDGRPVKAHQGGLFYRTRKTVRTHFAAVAIAVLIVISAVVSTAFGLRASQERDAAVRAQAHAESYARFLEDLFKEAAPDRLGSQEVSAIDLLDRGRQELLQSLSDTPTPQREQADLASSVGNIYRQLGQYEKAGGLLDRSIESWRRIVAGDDSTDKDGLRLAQVLNQRCGVAYRLGRWKEAERLIAESLAIRRRLGVEPKDLAPAINNLATIRLQRGLYADAEVSYREVLEIRTQAFGQQSAEVSKSLYALGALEFDRGDLAKSEELLRRALRLLMNLPEPPSTRIASVQSTLARVLQEEGRPRDAETLVRQALAIRQKLLPANHPDIALSKRDLAAVLLDLGQPATAQVLAKEALDSIQATSPDAEFWIATVESVLGACDLSLGGDEARTLLTRSQRTIERLRGSRSVYARQATRRLEALQEQQAH
jgi:serine/threonine-protein kinase